MLKREFKINFKSLIIWISIMMLFFGMVFLIYPSIMSSDASKQINEMMKIFPQELLQTMNMDIVGIESVFGWIQTEGYMFLTLIGGIYAATLGATILLKEENDKTIEFLFAKPVSRNHIVTAKIICGMINILIFTTVITIFNGIGLQLSNDLQWGPFLLLSLVPILLYFILFSISLFVSTFFQKTRKAMTIGLGITFISFLLQIIGNLGESAEIVKYFSPFEFVAARYLIENNHMNMTYLVVGIGVIILTIAGTYLRYNRKELE